MTQIDYFFGLGSPWAYVGLDAFAEVAQRHGATVVPHVIPLIEENGGIYSRNRPEARRAYWMTDLKRWAALRGKPLALEGRAALSDPAPAGRLVVAAWLDGQDWLAVARTLHEAFWAEGADIGNPEVRRALVGDALEDRAAAQDVTDRLAESRDFAQKSGVFGIPSYLVGDELFWGQDSLPFLDRHLTA